MPYKYKSPLEGSRYRLDLKTHKGEVFGVGLVSKKRNANVKDVLVHDAGVLAQYNITSPQFKLLRNMEDMAGTRPYKVPADVEKIKKFKRRVNRQGEWESY